MNDGELSIARDDEAGVIVASVAGGVDLSNARDLEEQLLLQAGESSLLLDLSNVRYLDSAGLAMIDRIARVFGTRDRTLRVVAPEGGIAHGVLRMAQLAGVPVTTDVGAVGANPGASD